MKRKNRMTAVLAGVLLAMSLTGCGENQIPDMTEEQRNEVKNYVAVTMMKYNMGRKSRLVDLSLYSDMGTVSEPEPGENSGMPEVDDTPIINSDETDQTDASGSGEKAYRMEEVLGFPEGVTIAYQGQGIYDSFPEVTEDSGFYMGASDGKKLLVMKFILSNAGEQDQAVDFGFPETVFRITVNGEYSRNALTTMLPGDIDMLTYNNVLSAGSSAEVVLVIEVDGDMEGKIESLDLGIQKESKAYHFPLANS